MTANLSGFGHQDPVIQAVSQTIAEAFQHEVVVATLPFSRNAMVYAREGGDLPSPSQDTFVTGGHSMQNLIGHLRMPGIWQEIQSGLDSAIVLTDDHCPILSLQRDSIERGAQGWVRSLQ